MHKSPFKFGLFLMASLMLSASVVAAIPIGNMNIFSNATAQGYNENYYEDGKYSKYPTNDYKYECQKGPFEGFFVSSVEFCDAKSFDGNKKKNDRQKDKPEPVTNPILTVSKEMLICSNPTITPFGVVPPVPGFNFFNINCRDASGTIPDPDSIVWIPWDECNINNFCPFFDEADFLMQIEQNPGPNFIRFEFPGNSDGRSVIVESGTYQINEEVSTSDCRNTNYENGQPRIEDGQPPDQRTAVFCFTLEGDCSGTIQAGEEKACTVKNYLDTGTFAVPQTGIVANGVTTTGTTTTQSSNVVGAPQSSNIGETVALQSSSVGTPNTLSSSSPPSSPLLNIFP